MSQLTVLSVATPDDERYFGLYRDENLLVSMPEGLDSDLESEIALLWAIKATLARGETVDGVQCLYFGEKSDFGRQIVENDGFLADLRDYSADLLDSGEDLLRKKPWYCV